MEILWLPSWYPNKTNPFEGDFIQRHARAAALFMPVHVVYFKRVSQGVHGDSVVVEEHRQGNLRETIVYYQAPRSGIALVDKIRSYRHYTRTYRNWLKKKFREENNVPALVHVHVCYRAGLIALWLRRKWRIPYILTEHWTVFAENAVPSYETLSFGQRGLIARVMKKASLVMPVSAYLEKMLLKRWPNLQTRVIPNVVDLRCFFPGSRRSDSTLKLIHISSLDPQKNPGALLKAANLLIQRGVSFQLEIYGARSVIAERFKLPSLNEAVRVHEEVSQEELGEALRKSDLLLLPSLYETFGCVIVEAHAAGVAVAATDLEVTRELITEDVNGLLIKGTTGEAVADVVQAFRNRRDRFEPGEIAATARRFSFETVGRQLEEIYRSWVSGRP